MAPSDRVAGTRNKKALILASATGFAVGIGLLALLLNPQPIQFQIYTGGLIDESKTLIVIGGNTTITTLDVVFLMSIILPIFGGSFKIWKALVNAPAGD